MADDLKIQLGIDVEALQRSASQATDALSRAFDKGIAANLLGNGLPATQGATPPQDTKNTIAGVIAALAQVNQTLVVGFNSLAGGVYLGGGGGGGGMGGGTGGGMGAGASPAGLAPPGPGTGVAGGRFGIAGQIISRAGDLAAALMPSSMKMFMGGFHSTDVMGFAHNLVSQIPIAGRLLGAITSPFHQVMQRNDEFKNMQYELFRDSGEDSMHAFTNLFTSDAYREQFTKRFGFSRAETQQLVGAGARRGIGQGQGMEAILNMQGTLGLGMESAGALGDLRRGGMKPGQETEVMANAIGVAVATGLERGRWGEMLTLWQRAAASAIDTDVAWKEVAAQQQFIGSLGARFRGDSPAAQSMDQALRAMASNTQSPLALRGAMELTGGDFFGATARMARSAEQPDLALQESVINQLLGTPGVQAWLAMPDGPDADRALDRIAGVAETFGTGLSQLKIAALLKARKGAMGTMGPLFGAPPTEAVDIGRQVAVGGAALPEIALGPRRSQTEAQRPSDISAIQPEAPLVPGGPAGQLKRAMGDRMRRIADGDPSAMWTMEELRSGKFTLDFDPPPGEQIPVRTPEGTPSSSMTVPGGGAAGATAPTTSSAGGQESIASSSYQQFVMQGFGNQIPGRAPHPGVDLAFPPGTAVTSPVDGVVEHINRHGVGIEVGAAIHIRAADGVLWKLYHIDPATFPANLRVGQRISQGTSLGRTYSIQNWQSPGGGQVRTHLHVGQIGAGGVALDPMRPGGIAPGSLTGGVSPGADAPAPGMVGGGAGAGNNVHVTADVHVHVTNDAAGRPQVRVRTATPAVTSSPGQIVGGQR